MSIDRNTSALAKVEDGKGKKVLSFSPLTIVDTRLQQPLLTSEVELLRVKRGHKASESATREESQEFNN